MRTACFPRGAADFDVGDWEEAPGEEDDEAYDDDVMDSSIYIIYPFGFCIYLLSFCLYSFLFCSRISGMWGGDCVFFSPLLS